MCLCLASISALLSMGVLASAGRNSRDCSRLMRGVEMVARRTWGEGGEGLSLMNPRTPGRSGSPVTMSTEEVDGLEGALMGDTVDEGEGVLDGGTVLVMVG